jgi:DNA-binding CsgD family transcriptional regulator
MLTNAEPPFDDLSPRQLQAAKLAAEGHTTREIANAMRISVPTARDHLDSARRKLGVTRKREIGRVLRERRILDQQIG